MINEYLLNKYYIRRNVWESVSGKDGLEKFTTTRRENIFILIGMPMKFELKNRTNTIKSNQSHQDSRTEFENPKWTTDKVSLRFHRPFFIYNANWMRMCAHQMNRENWHDGESSNKKIELNWSELIVRVCESKRAREREKVKQTRRNVYSIFIVVTHLNKFRKILKTEKIE